MKSFLYNGITFEHKLSKNQNIFFPKHLHNEWEIYLFQNGTARYIVGNQMLKLQNNDLLIVPPQAFHRVIIDSDNPYERTIINFPADKIDSDIISKLQELPTKINIDDNLLVKSIIHSIEPIIDDREKQVVSTTIIKSVELISLHLFNQNQQKLEISTQQNLFSSLFSNMLSYIDEHLCEKLTLKTLAKTFYTSASWISHHFKQTLGVSCVKYINSKRILRAQKLIQQGQSPTEVYLKYCYADYSSFYRQYKQILGVSPAEDKP